MGEIYLAEDTKLELKVALRFLPMHYTKDLDVSRGLNDNFSAIGLSLATINDLFSFIDFRDVFVARNHVISQSCFYQQIIT